MTMLPVWNLVCGVLVVLVARALAADTIYTHCDPAQPQNGNCPAGYCCVRDAFQPTLVYCGKIGQVGESCSVQPMDSSCPCAAGLHCKPNIKTAVFESMFGRCSNQSSTP